MSARPCARVCFDAGIVVVAVNFRPPLVGSLLLVFVVALEAAALLTRSIAGDAACCVLRYHPHIRALIS